jgi:hypothetical protein
VAFSRPVMEHIILTLPTDEAKHQQTTNPIWDRKPQGKGTEWSAKLITRTLPEVLKARMRVVHPKCGEHM